MKFIYQRNKLIKQIMSYFEIPWSTCRQTQFLPDNKELMKFECWRYCAPHYSTWYIDDIRQQLVVNSANIGIDYGFPPMCFIIPYGENRGE